MSDESVEEDEKVESDPGEEFETGEDSPSDAPTADSDVVDDAEEEESAEEESAGRARFSFVRALGQGVLGEAYEVIDEVTSEPVVLKVFARATPAKPSSFKLEFEALSRLKNPALVPFHHLVDPASDTNIAVESVVGETGLAFTQDYVDAVDLTTWLRRPMTPEESAALEERRAPTTGEVPRDPITGDLVDPEAETIESKRAEKSDEIPREDS